MAFETSRNPLDAVFDLLGRKLELDAEADRQQRELSAFDQFPSYGIDEYGRAFLRGEPSASMPGGAALPPLALIGAGILVVALLFYFVKR